MVCKSLSCLAVCLSAPPPPRFIRPGYARDTSGKWQVIVQTESLPQRVAIDLCRASGQTCEWQENTHTQIAR